MQVFPRSRLRLTLKTGSKLCAVSVGFEKALHLRMREPRALRFREECLGRLFACRDFSFSEQWKPSVCVCPLPTSPGELVDAECSR